MKASNECAMNRLMDFFFADPVSVGAKLIRDREVVEMLRNPSDPALECRLSPLAETGGKLITGTAMSCGQEPLGVRIEISKAVRRKKRILERSLNGGSSRKRNKG